MSESVSIEVQINSPIDEVWSAITTSETMSQWMMFKQNNFEPRVGHQFQLSGVEGYDQTIECEVKEIDKPNTLSYTWAAHGGDGEMTETLVTFTLTEVDGGTNLHLVQSGFRADAKQELGGAKGGWQYMLSELENVLSAA